MSRFIGITHRVKRTAEGESRPTKVTILDNGKKPVEYELDDETDEWDFIEGRYPVSYRNVVPGEDLSDFLPRHIKRDKDTGEPSRVPAAFAGIRPSDTIATSLGGSGGYLAYAIARKCEALGAGTKIIRITPKLLSDARGTAAKDKDATLLATLGRDQPQLFLPMQQVDLDQIRLQIAWRDRSDTMKDRIACEQRLHQRIIGRTFVTEGIAPERTLEEAYLAAKASDVIHQNLVKEEGARIREVEKILYALPAWGKVFEPLEGCGPMIATRLLVAIGDIRRFATAPKLKKFAGVAVTKDGKFWRRRKGEVAGWHPELRQGLYLLADQWNRRPGSIWGQKLLCYKEVFQTKHPEIVIGENGKKKYTKAHIHKMAVWRTITKFVEWLFDEWTRVAKAEDDGNGNNAQAA